MESKVRLKFLGIRALHDAPSSANTVYGGNTNCIVIEDGDNIFVINGGFGINPFGDALQGRALKAKQPVSCDIFLSDFLWENIMGLPLFTPIHFKSNQLTIHSALAPADASQKLSAICSPNFSPFDGVSSLRAPLMFPVAESVRTIGDWQIQLVKMPHPMAPYPSATWIFQHQNGFKIGFVGPIANNSATRQKLKKHISNCNILVHPGIAPHLSHPTMTGRWSFEDAIRFGQEVQAVQTFVTGIHPMLNDLDLLHAEVELSRKLGLAAGMQFSIAREWTAIDLPIGKSQKKAG